MSEAKPIEFGECEQCGGHDLVIETDSKETEMYYDGDLITCLECGQKGQFSCDSETEGYISWIYED